MRLHQPFAISIRASWCEALDWKAFVRFYRQSKSVHLPCQWVPYLKRFFIKKRRRLCISASFCDGRSADTNMCWPGTVLIHMCPGAQSICHPVGHKRQSMRHAAILVAIVSDFWGIGSMRHHRLLRMGPETPRSAPAEMKFQRGTWNPNPRRARRISASLFRRELPHRAQHRRIGF